MSLIVSGIRLPFEQADASALEQARRQCGLGKNQVTASRIYKKSLDLRHGKLTKVFSVLLDTPLEGRVLQQQGEGSIRKKAAPLQLSPGGEKKMAHPPVVVGLGPAGLFAALILAEQGCRPLVLEQGAPLPERDRVIKDFQDGGPLNEKINIQFGEGGAGAYSDGKLTTRIHDPRCELVLEQLLRHGAPPETALAAKPHIGTDLLKGVVTSIRQRIQQLGGQVEFYCTVTGFRREGDRLKAIVTDKGEIPCEVAVLAVGHSARPLFRTLAEEGFALTRKAFSVGVRAEHLQETIDRGRYGAYAGKAELPPAEYNLSWRQGERACYSFCMCPGGQVVAAASEQGGVVTNGMSYHARDGRNANAALAVSVLPEDLPGSDPLEGVRFQRQLEQKAFQIAGADFAAPVQTYGDLREGRVSSRFGRVQPTYDRGTEFADLRQVLPPFVWEMLLGAMPRFGRQVPGFDGEDTLFTGVETRTSSPVRILRGEDLFAPGCQGLIPCGEGAGYAGGIMSAAVDGIRAAERILEEYRPLEE